MIIELLLQVIYCILSLAAVIVPCVLVLLPVRFKAHVPGFVFRKLLHTAAFAGIALMIVTAKSWHAAAITSVLVAVFIHPLMLCFEKTSWYSTFAMEKSPGEVRKSISLLFFVLAVLICISGGVFGKLKLAAAAVVTWGTGDAAAALVGVPFGKRKISSRLSDGKKSWEGSAAMLGVSFVFCLAMLLFLDLMAFPAALAAAALSAAAASFVELISSGLADTVTVPSAVLAVLLIIDAMVS